MQQVQQQVHQQQRQQGGAMGSYLESLAQGEMSKRRRLLGLGVGFFRFGEAGLGDVVVGPCLF